MKKSGGTSFATENAEARRKRKKRIVTQANFSAEITNECV
jgi:hypothetical protein